MWRFATRECKYENEVGYDVARYCRDTNWTVTLGWLPQVANISQS